MQASVGITLRHQRHCQSRKRRDCDCRPSFQAQAFAAKQGKVVRRTFPTLREAKRWRAEAQVDLRRGLINVPSDMTLHQTAMEWLDAAEAGVVRTRSGTAYKPAARRTYAAALRSTILPELGALRLSAVSKPRVQQLIDRLVGEGYSPSTVRNAILPLRAIFRRAVEREDVAVNPTERLSLPTDDRVRERVVEAREARSLLEALPEAYQPLWAAALFTGLRRGELQALRWEVVDMAAGILRVEYSWDPVEGLVAPKSRSGRRTVPLPDVLRPYLIKHRLSERPESGGFVFTRTQGRPFDPSNMVREAKRAWGKARLEPIKFHECRHAYASLMIAAGVNAKALSSYMGHSSITVTLDRYGHLMPGNEREAADLLDGYLRRGGLEEGGGDVRALVDGD